jgi:4-hydroxy-3-methylbut-2-enyl diphosphate reductase
VLDRDGDTAAFHFFDTTCGATQERQDALFDMLKKPMDVLLVVGGYNSSNTAHLVEIAEPEVPTFFIRGASCIHSLGEIAHYDLHRREEIVSRGAEWLDPQRPVTIGITAGASCPNNLNEDTILKEFDLRGVPADALATLD